VECHLHDGIADGIVGTLLAFRTSGHSGAIALNLQCFQPSISYFWLSASSPTQDLQAELKRLRTEAEDCDKIGNLTTDIQKRDLFKMLACELREMVRHVEIVIASRKRGHSGLWSYDAPQPFQVV
jgi:hypothetical protein